MSDNNELKTLDIIKKIENEIIEKIEQYQSILKYLPGVEENPELKSYKIFAGAAKEEKDLNYKIAALQDVLKIIQKYKINQGENI